MARATAAWTNTEATDWEASDYVEVTKFLQQLLQNLEYLAQSHVHSGDPQGSSTLTPAILNVPTAAAPVPTVEGRMNWDSDDDKLVVGDGTGQKHIVPTASVSGDATMSTAGAVTVAATHAGSAHHNAVTIGADGQHSLATQVLSGVAASETQAGHAELATAPEINTGTDATRPMAPSQFVASNRNVRYIILRVLPAATAHTVSTTVGGDFEMPFTGTITEIGAYADTAGVTGLGTIDVNKGGVTILSTKITLDSTEKTSRTAATPPVISVSAITAGDLVTVDIDGIQTTAALGLTIRLGVRQT